MDVGVREWSGMGVEEWGGAGEGAGKWGTGGLQGGVYSFQMSLGLLSGWILNEWKQEIVKCEKKPLFCRIHPITAQVV